MEGLAAESKNASSKRCFFSYTVSQLIYMNEARCLLIKMLNYDSTGRSSLLCLSNPKKNRVFLTIAFQNWLNAHLDHLILMIFFSFLLCFLKKLKSCWWRNINGYRVINWKWRHSSSFSIPLNRPACSSCFHRLHSILFFSLLKVELAFPQSCLVQTTDEAGGDRDRNWIICYSCFLEYEEPSPRTCDWNLGQLSMREAISFKWV